MNGFLLDTHIWIWFLIGSPRLPTGLRKRIADPSAECWLSPTSVWEAGLLIRRGRLSVAGDGRAWVAKALEMFPFREAIANSEVALAAGYTRLTHLDPADAFIAATAVAYDLRLMTVDRHLRRLSWLPTLSR